MPPTGQQFNRIREIIAAEMRGYRTFDFMLDALASLKVLLSPQPHGKIEIEETAKECEAFYGKPRLRHPDESNRSLLKPDCLTMMSGGIPIPIELKFSWDDRNLTQVANYARATVLLNKDGNDISIRQDRYVAVGYARPIRRQQVIAIERAIRDANPNALPIVFAYEHVSRPRSVMQFRTLNQVNNPHGLAFVKLFEEGYFPISVDSYKFERSGLHTTNDEVPACYAAILWLQSYAHELLSEEQKMELQQKGRLSTPLVFTDADLEGMPVPQEIETPLEPHHIRKALKYLRQAQLVEYRVRKQEYRVKLKPVATIRLPATLSETDLEQYDDLTAKTISRYAYYKVMKPVPKRQVARGKRRRRGKKADKKQLKLKFKK